MEFIDENGGGPGVRALPTRRRRGPIDALLVRLAKAELFAKISTKVTGGVWMAVAGILAFIA